MKQIPLYGKDGLGKFALVDDENYEFLMQWRWFGTYQKTSSNFYVTCNLKIGNKWGQGRMHNMVKPPSKGKLIDHIDGNTLNNQKSNLRESTSAQNSQNKGKYKNCASRYKGVSKSKSISSGKNKKIKYTWMSRIQVNKKSIYLGNFSYTGRGEICAAECYNRAALKYFGEFARLNDIHNPVPAKQYEDKKPLNKHLIEREKIKEHIKIIEPEYIKRGIRLIPLTQGKFAMVDIDDYDYYNQWNWCCKDSEYPIRHLKRTKDGKRETIYLHKEVMGAKKGQIVDHIDRNKANACKSNLRFATSIQNSGNSSFRSVKKYTKYVGVFKIFKTNRKTKKKTNYWMAQLHFNYKKYDLGVFPYTPCGEILAALKYDEAVIKHRKEFANLNFPI